MYRGSEAQNSTRCIRCVPGDAWVVAVADAEIEMIRVICQWPGPRYRSAGGLFKNLSAAAQSDPLLRFQVGRCLPPHSAGIATERSRVRVGRLL